jgi:hypothetical protein
MDLILWVAKTTADPFSWAPVVAAGIAAVSGILVLIGGFVLGRVTARSENKAEHARWLRDRRISAYLEVLHAVDTARDITRTMKENEDSEELGVAVRRMFDGVSTLGVLGPPRVRVAGTRLTTAFRELLEAQTADAKQSKAAQEKAVQGYNKAQIDFSVAAKGALGIDTKRLPWRERRRLKRPKTTVMTAQ